jgi:UV DNA damage endonuclease
MLLKALAFCKTNHIGAFRVTSELIPYSIQFTEYSSGRLKDLLHTCFCFAYDNNIRLSFHPDQFVVLSSNDLGVIKNSLTCLKHHGDIANLLKADVITIHGGGMYGDKASALCRLIRSLYQLNPKARKLVTLENDDKCYTPKDLLPICKTWEIPLIYDVHHHRCNPDGMSEEEVTEECIKIWELRGQEPLFHLSSPKTKETPRSHADYIDVKDFPDCWRGKDITVDIEAKAKELAIFKLWEDLRK